MPTNLSVTYELPRMPPNRFDSAFVTALETEIGGYLIDQGYPGADARRIAQALRNRYERWALSPTQRFFVADIVDAYPPAGGGGGGMSPV